MPRALPGRCTCAPLPLARNAVVVAVHLRARTVVDEPGRLGAGGHLGTVGSAIAAEGCRRRCSNRAARQGCRLRCEFLALVRRREVPVAPSARDGHERDNGEGAKQRCFGLLDTGTGCLRRAVRTHRESNHVDGLRLSVPASAEFIAELLSRRGASSVARKRADVNEDLCAPVCRSDEAEAAVIIPGAKSARAPHCETTDRNGARFCPICGRRFASDVESSRHSGTCPEIRRSPASPWSTKRAVMAAGPRVEPSA